MRKSYIFTEDAVETRFSTPSFLPTWVLKSWSHKSRGWRPLGYHISHLWCFSLNAEIRRRRSAALQLGTLNPSLYWTAAGSLGEVLKEIDSANLFLP